MLISWPPQVVLGAGSFHVIHWLAVLDVGYAVLQRHINYKFEQGESPALYVSCNTAYTLPCGLGHFPPLGGCVINSASSN